MWVAWCVHNFFIVIYRWRSSAALDRSNFSLKSWLATAAPARNYSVTPAIMRAVLTQAVSLKNSRCKQRRCRLKRKSYISVSTVQNRAMIDVEVAMDMLAHSLKRRRSGDLSDHLVLHTAITLGVCSLRLSYR